MARQNSVVFGGNDPRLAPLIAAEGEEEWQEAIERLIVDDVRPLIDSILSRARDPAIVADREDIAGTIVLRLIRRLKSVPGSEDDAIVSLDDFVARLTGNAVCDLMRRRSPERTRLKNRVRYVVAHDPRFAAYTAGGSGAGLASWPPPRFMIEPLPRAARNVPADITPDRTKTADAVHAILRHAGRAVLLDDLVRLLAETWNIVDLPAEALGANLPSNETMPLIRFEARQYLSAVWNEVSELPPHQRTALLLNLRDPDYRNAIALFVMTGIVTADRIAEVLGMTAEQLAEIWNDLPLDDLAIAEMLGVARQQVINYRRSARERLVRRLKR
jgi:DNA-directed RNA polymerase specialized sigma24 family protein